MHRHTNKYYRIKERCNTFKQRLRPLTIQSSVNIFHCEPVITKEIIYHRKNAKSCFTFGECSNNMQNTILRCLSTDKIDDSVSIIFVPASSFSYVLFFLDKDDQVKEMVHVISPTMETTIDTSIKQDNYVLPLFETIDQIPQAWKTDDIKTLPSSMIYLVCDAKQLHSPNILITVNEMGEICHAQYVLSADQHDDTSLPL